VNIKLLSASTHAHASTNGCIQCHRVQGARASQNLTPKRFRPKFKCFDCQDWPVCVCVLQAAKYVKKTKQITGRCTVRRFRRIIHQSSNKKMEILLGGGRAATYWNRFVVSYSVEINSLVLQTSSYCFGVSLFPRFICDERAGRRRGSAQKCHLLFW